MFEQQHTVSRQVPRLLRGLLAVALPVGLVAVPAKVGVAQNTAFLSVVGAGCAFLIIRGLLRERARTKDIREFAQRMGLLYLGAAVPKSFPLHRTSSRQARSITRAVAGDRGQKELVVFDCKLGYFERTFFRTVVAVRGGQAGFGPCQFGAGLVTEQVGEWTLVYGSDRQLLLEEIEALVSAI